MSFCLVMQIGPSRFDESRTELFVDSRIATASKLSADPKQCKLHNAKKPTALSLNCSNCGEVFGKQSELRCHGLVCDKRVDSEHAKDISSDLASKPRNAKAAKRKSSVPKKHCTTSKIDMTSAAVCTQSAARKGELKCSSCDKCFKSLDSLWLHVKRQHSDDRQALNDLQTTRVLIRKQRLQLRKDDVVACPVCNLCFQKHHKGIMAHIIKVVCELVLCYFLKLHVVCDVSDLEYRAYRCTLDRVFVLVIAL